MKSSISAAALLSLVAHVASSAIPSSSAFAEPVTATTTADGTGIFSQGTATTVAGSFTVPTTFFSGATQTVTIPGDCVCPSGSFTTNAPVPTTVTISSGPVPSASTVTISAPAGTISVTSFSAVPTATGGSATFLTSTVVVSPTHDGTTIFSTTVAPTTVQAPTVTLTASTTTFVATGTAISAVTSYFATGTPVSAVTSFFGTATAVPAITSYYATATAVPTLLPSTVPVVTVTMISSTAGCTCPQTSDAALKLKDTSSAMSRSGRAEGTFAVVVAGILATLI